MRLREPRDRRHIRAAEVVSGPEVEPEKSFFDPHTDFPESELDRLKKMVRNRQDQTHTSEQVETVQDAWWLTLVDDEFKELLQKDVFFEQQSVNLFPSHLPAAPTGVSARLASFISGSSPNKDIHADTVLQRILPIIQLFPAQRLLLRQKHTDRILPILMGEGQSPTQRHQLFFPLVSLYPEKRQELMEKFSIHSENIVERLKGDIAEPELLEETKASLVAGALLVFPEKRPDILALVKGKEADGWLEIFKRMKQPMTTHGLALGFDLTVIGAESAIIDASGQIQIQWERQAAIHTRPPLPARAVG